MILVGIEWVTSAKAFILGKCSIDTKQEPPPQCLTVCCRYNDPTKQESWRRNCKTQLRMVSRVILSTAPGAPKLHLLLIIHCRAKWVQGKPSPVALTRTHNFMLQVRLIWAYFTMVKINWLSSVSREVVETLLHLNIWCVCMKSYVINLLVFISRKLPMCSWQSWTAVCWTLFFSWSLLCCSARIPMNGKWRKERDLLWCRFTNIRKPRSIELSS